MSCIASYYILPETKRPEFAEARRTEKTVTTKRTFFGTKQVVTGERYLWEYLNDVAKPLELPFSGFMLVAYLFTFLELPEALRQAAKASSLDKHYLAYSAELAAELANHLEAHPPSTAALEEFAEEENAPSPAEYVEALRETHAIVVDWFRRTQPGSFGVLHLSF